MKNDQNGNNNKNGFHAVLRTLGYRNFRLFFGGQGLSLIGTWMQQVAMAWLVYRLTGSALMLGLVNFCARIPIFLASPFLGVLADRCNRHRIIIFTQSLSMLQALTLTVLVYSHQVRVWHLFSLSLFIGIVNAMDIPARQSFLIEMVENKEDLSSAIALNSSLVNSARLIGPSVAGILIAAAGEGLCFLINTLSYLAVIVALLLMRISPRRIEPRTSSVLQQFKEGARYAYGFTPIRAILLLVSLVSLMGLPYMVLMPVFARDIYHQGAHGLGFLTGAAGVGSLAGALFLAARKSVLGLGRVIVRATFLFGTSLLIFSHFPFFWPALGLLALSGFGMIVLLASANTVLQTIVDDNKRGRLMSFFAMSFGGMVPFGSVMAGALASTIGARNTVLAGGLVCIAGGLWFAKSLPRLRTLVHPIYVQKGILREVAVGLQSATEQAAPPKINGNG